MNYPNGKKRKVKQVTSQTNNQGYSNRGMSLEADINVTNTYYLETDKAVIHKKPTPVQIVNVKYPKRSAAVITEAYFKQASTTDYNGIYRNHYIDFEAKETKNKTLFPLSNIHEHQIKHMQSIIKHGGISFFIIRFSSYNETYLFPGENLFPYWYEMLEDGRKSIPYEKITQDGKLIPFQYQVRVDYLSIVDTLYF
ncbi:recombination protein U [Oceanobacillus limi]|uniref:Holliday junction resolvase RecU n=1 Tax=Oceanobacillus limi TaxID=930131 RepID=A0A1H9ZEI2_9BACI|nr:Holliday junction resolvase RecU [Oceanobacillus limi]SES79927.1 recombination protein U [Oceanobacillus limi]